MELSSLLTDEEPSENEVDIQNEKETIRLSVPKCELFIVIICMIIFSVVYTLKFKNEEATRNVTSVTVVHYDPHIDFENISTKPCQIENWNKKNTNDFPVYSLYKKFSKKGMSGSEGLSDGELRLLTAFLYEDYIVVTHTAQNAKGVGRPAFCYYYDCNRKELPGTRFESFVFPMTAVHCPRRIGAKYMSLSFEKDKPPTEEPIPLLNRIFEYPPHEIGVCVGQIYGDEKKWLEIIEYIEHHKLMGATMFYFTILEMDGYTKRTIEDYQRIGEVEATFVHLEYEKINWLFHMIQVHECFFRSKFHSKWVLSTDLDERLVMTQMPLVSYLRHQPSSICEINFGSRRVPKFDDNPSVYTSQQQISESLTFLRYNMTSEHHWLGFKLIFKPAKVHMIHFHWTWRQHEGCHVKTASERIGYIRHYRTTSSNSLRGNWLHLMKPYQISKMDEKFVKKLKRKVLEKLKYIYELHPIYCSSIDQKIRNKFKNDLHCV